MCFACHKYILLFSRSGDNELFVCALAMFDFEDEDDQLSVIDFINDAVRRDFNFVLT